MQSFQIGDSLSLMITLDKIPHLSTLDHLNIQSPSKSIRHTLYHKRKQYPVSEEREEWRWKTDAARR